MHLDPLYIQVLPKLTNTGSSERVQGLLPLTSIDVGFRHFDVAEGIGYDALLTNTSEAILLNGTATASLSTNCDRCLEKAELNLSGEIQGYYLFEPLEAPEEGKLEAYELVDPAGRIDIAPPVLAAIVYELPPVALCKPDCQGLLDQNPLSSQTAPVEESELESEVINPLSPFAALKDFPFEEEGAKH